MCVKSHLQPIFCPLVSFLPWIIASGCKWNSRGAGAMAGTWHWWTRPTLNGGILIEIESPDSINPYQTIFLKWWIPWPTFSKSIEIDRICGFSGWSSPKYGRIIVYVYIYIGATHSQIDMLDRYCQVSSLNAQHSDNFAMPRMYIGQDATATNRFLAPQSLISGSTRSKKASLPYTIYIHV